MAPRPTAPQALHGLRAATGVHPATPLWQRVPTRDADGTRLGDFMMLLPGLRQRPPEAQRALIARLDAVLWRQRGSVVFADCNLRLNLLWISVRNRPHAWRAVAEAVRAVVPEARLVSPEGPATWSSTRWRGCRSR